MSYTITSATGEEFENWNRYVSRSNQSSPFHRREGIELLADKTNTTLHPLLGIKGEQVIGIFPLFTEKRGPFELVLSPPLQTVINLGPILLDTEQLNQRKLERRNRKFVMECINWIDERFGTDYIDIRTTDRYPDLRPFKDSGFSVEPNYTHVLDVSDGLDTLIQSFSGDARSKIRKTDANRYHIEEGDVEDAVDAMEQVQERHGDELENIYLDGDFVARLFSDFPDGMIRVFVCYDGNGAKKGGIITIDHDETVVSFGGGAKEDRDLPVNELIDWHIIQDAHNRGFKRYDFEGANAWGISQYKSKFAPDLIPWYKAVRVTPQAKLALGLRKKLQPIGNILR